MSQPGTPQGGEFELFFGAAATHFPGAEILQDFAPAEHIIPQAKNRNIAEIPGEPNLMLRWAPANQIRAQWIRAQGYTSLEQAAKDTNEQYAILTDQGVTVPPHRLFMGTGPADTPAAGKQVTFTVVPKIAEAPILSTRDQRGVTVVTGLARYLCAEPRKATGRLARDIYLPEQYAGPTLLDLEPAVSTDSLSRGALGAAGAAVYTWAMRLGMHRHKDVQRLKEEQHLNI